MRFILEIGKEEGRVRESLEIVIRNILWGGDLGRNGKE